MMIQMLLILSSALWGGTPIPGVKVGPSPAIYNLCEQLGPNLRPFKAALGTDRRIVSTHGGVSAHAMLIGTHFTPKQRQALVLWAIPPTRGNRVQVRVRMPKGVQWQVQVSLISAQGQGIIFQPLDGPTDGSWFTYTQNVVGNDVERVFDLKPKASNTASQSAAKQWENEEHVFVSMTVTVKIPKDSPLIGVKSMMGVDDLMIFSKNMDTK